jgi:DNA mismatch endonuclease vsr
MADNHSKEARSRNMARIRSVNSRPEEIVRRYLFAHGLRYRKNVRAIPGCPDIVLRKYRVIIFVHGCFWHHHDCGRFVWPTTNESYWRKKIARNVTRDEENMRLLSYVGWRVFVIWECELKKDVAEENLRRLYENIVMIDEI